MLRKMNSRKGFTLVEIMIVVAIIGLLVAIAIPNLLRARLNANEGAARAAMRTLSTAAEGYRSAQVPPAYPSALSDFIAPISVPPYIDNNLANATAAATARQGYTYTYVRDNANPGVNYSVVGAPANLGVTGNTVFCVDSTGVIVGGVGAAAPTGGAGVACAGGAPIA